MVTEFVHKNHFYSLKQCKEFLRNISGNMDYAENEGMLTSCFHYLEEYENRLRKEYISELPILFYVQCIKSNGIYDATIKGEFYRVVEELETQYVIVNYYGDFSTLQKDKFIKCEERIMKEDE